MSTAYWHYFISLEKDFIRTLDFVDLAPANSDCFGDNFAKMILAIGSEVDVISKALCFAINPASTAHNILHYRDEIAAAYPQIHEASILVERTDLEITPWASWSPEVSKSPTWWTAYNNVKHDRIANLTQGNQKNALTSLCGLLVLNRYFHHRTGQNSNIDHPQPLPSLLDAGSPGYLLSRSRTNRIPGI
jgi:hypothetical protein